MAALNAGQWARAEALLDAMSAPAEAGEAAYLRAVLRNAQGRRDEALALLARAAELLPGRGDVAYNHGAVLCQAGRLAEAAAEWSRALALVPDHAAAAYNLARALADLGRADEAEAAYRRLLGRQPGHRDAAFNLGNLLHRRGRLEDALQAFDALTAAHAGFAPGWVNRGKTLAALERDGEAEACYRRALAFDPRSVQAHWNLAVLLLGQGRWRDGLDEFDWRLALPEAPKFTWPQPVWRGDAPPGTRVLVWNDQGRGDAIQFLRYARGLAALGAQVLALVQPDLKALAATVPGVAAAFAFGEPLPAFDAHAPLLSLPRLLGHDGPQAGWTGPYVAAEPDPDLPRRPGRPLVGLVWAGNPDHANDANRSMRLEDLAALLAVEGVDFVSLQAGTAARQLDASPWAGRIADLSARLVDFAATARLVRALDLVVAVDTAVAHLAGAAGTPVWAVLPKAGVDWRWGRDGDATVWYPAMRLFRQHVAGDWTAPVGRAAAALADVAPLAKFAGP